MKKEIGGWVIQEPNLVTRLTVFIDRENSAQLPRIWREAEDSVTDKAFDAAFLFYEENLEKGGLIHSTRYYTPEKNRVPSTWDNTYCICVTAGEDLKRGDHCVLNLKSNTVRRARNPDFRETDRSRYVT